MKSKSFIGRIYVVLAWLVLGVSLLATGIGFFGRSNWMLDDFSHFRPFLFIALLLMLPLGLKLSAKKTWYYLAGIAVLVNLFEIFPCCFKSNWAHAATASSANSKILHLAMLNVEAGNRNSKPIIEWATAIKVDVLVLHEIYAEWVDDIKPLDEIYPYKVLGQGKDGQWSGIFSRYPLTPGIERKDNWSRSILSAKVVWNTREISIVALHPLSPRNEQSWSERNRQLNALAEELNKIAGPKLVMADLNTTRFSPIYHDLENSTHLRNASNGYGFCATWPTEYAQYGLGIGIDHILMSSEFDVVHFQVGKRNSSDHLPLQAELWLP